MYSQMVCLSFTDRMLRVRRASALFLPGCLFLDVPRRSAALLNVG